jgi:GWxTD domain-containing protein
MNRFGGFVKRLFVALAGLAFAASAMAQLSKYKDWDRTPEAYFLTPAERDEWKKVASDADAEKFIVIYFAKRGGDQFREGIKRRISAADEQFKMRRQKGSESARGRVFIVLGNPSKLQQARPTGQTDVSATSDRGLGDGAAPDIEARAAKPQIWIYEASKFDASWGIGELTIHFNVDEARGSDEISTEKDRLAADKAISTVASKSIVAPNATGATAPAPAAGAPAAAPPSGGAPAGGAAGAPAPAAAVPAAIVPLPAAVKTALLAAAPPPAGQAGFWSGPFRSGAGEEFLALQFYLPADKPANAGGSPLKIAGVVTDASGAEVQSFWEDASFSEIAEGTRKDRAVDKSVSLPPGTYKGTFGLFTAEGQPPVVSSSTSFTLNPKSTEFEVSPLILSSGLVPLTKRPGPYDPFVFGSDKPIKVEPKGDRAFTKQDSLWYFYEVSNPTLPAAAAAPAESAAPAPSTTPGAGSAAAPPAAADAPKPRVMTRINVQRDGQDAFAPFTGPADLMPVSAGGQYGTGSEIPLASFEPGNYTFAIRVWDLNAPAGSAAKKGYERKEEFIVLMPDGSLPPKKAAAPPAPTPKKK